MSSRNKKPAAGRNDEDAPLLADDGSERDVDSDRDNEEAARGDPSKESTVQKWLRTVWHWLLHNLMAVVIILLLLGGIIALCIYFAATTKPQTSARRASICTTPGCVLAASEILENISPRHHEIDPCTDFDKFVCEGWEEKHDLRPDQSSAFTGTTMLENSQQILRHVLETPDAIEYQAIEGRSVAKERIFEKLHDAYAACTNEDRIKQIGSAPLINILRNINDLFPASRPYSDTQSLSHSTIHDQKPVVLRNDDRLSNVIAYLASIGVNALLSIDVGADDKDPDVVVPYISALREPGLPSKEYYKDPQLVARYGKTIGQVLEALLVEAGPDSSRLHTFQSLFSTRNAEIVEGIVLLESKLAKATPDSADFDDVTKYYNPYTLTELNALLPQFSIENIILKLAPTHYSPDKVVVRSPSYLKALSSALQETNAGVLQAYLVWKTVQTYLYDVEDNALTPLVRFNNELLGKDPDSRQERWRTCIRVVDNGLGWILSKFFIEKAFSKEAKDFGDRVVLDIKSQFIKKLMGAEWMSKEVRELGIDKVHNIVQKIGYPTKSPDIRDSSAIQEYYASVNISRAAFFENALSIAKFDVRRQWSALGKPTDRDEWGMTADTVNAYYNPAGNEIVFPAGIMQAPVFYDPTIPQYLSYGAFGSVSGHELSHAFDSTGRHYDEIGNFTDWWDGATVESFKDKAQCFVDQYHKYTVPNPNGEPLHLNGQLTLGENIADAGGVNAAFAAWKQREHEKPSKFLPGLQNFSKEQAFFISYGNFWCGKSRPEAAVNSVYRDPHSPPWARILGTMANSKDFREAFNCPVKEPTCELW